MGLHPPLFLTLCTRCGQKISILLWLVRRHLLLFAFYYKFHHLYNISYNDGALIIGAPPWWSYYPRLCVSLVIGAETERWLLGGRPYRHFWFN